MGKNILGSSENNNTPTPPPLPTGFVAEDAQKVKTAPKMMSMPKVPLDKAPSVLKAAKAAIPKPKKEEAPEAPAAPAAPAPVPAKSGEPPLPKFLRKEAPAAPPVPPAPPAPPVAPIPPIPPLPSEAVKSEPESEPLLQAPAPPPLPTGFRSISEPVPIPEKAYEEPVYKMPVYREPEAVIPPKKKEEVIAEETFAEEVPVRAFENSTPSGRFTMSLEDAEREKFEEEERARIEAARPRVYANGGELFEGDYCFARSYFDGLYYYGSISAFDDSRSEILFFDGVKATVDFKYIYTVEEACDKMQCFGNWNNRGNFFPAVVDEIGEELTIHYEEKSTIVETISPSRVRFAVW